MPYDRRCRELAMYVLTDYRLSAEEKREEIVRLAETIQRVIEDELESLADRRKA